MADQNGKQSNGKQKASAEGRAGEAQQTGKSLAARVVASANSLAKDITSNSGGSLAAVLTAGPSSSAKPSSAGPATSGPSEIALQTRTVTSSAAPLGSQHAQFGESFRSGNSEFTAQGSVDGFMTQEDPFAPISHNNDSSTWAADFHSGTSGANVHQFTAGLQHDLDDGAEVRALLSNPDFVAITDVYDMDDPTPEATAELFSNSDLSIEGQETAERLRMGLGPAPTYQQVGTTNPINLLPQFDDAQDLEGPTTQVFLTTSQREEWFAQWTDVLDRYTDDVWGEYLPIVQQSRRHLEEVHTGEENLDPKAISRLKMILGHMEIQQPVVSRNTEPIETRQTMANEQRERINYVRSQLSQPASSQRSRSIERRQNEIEIPVAEATERRMSTATARTGSLSAASDLSSFEFHCPWISCSEQFHSLKDLRRHSATHQPYACAHVSCQESFSHKKEWADHIKIAHHDLLDTSASAVIPSK